MIEMVDFRHPLPAHILSNQIPADTNRHIRIISSEPQKMCRADLSALPDHRDKALRRGVFLRHAADHRARRRTDAGAA